jgi:serine O-acetyltransferase
VQPQINWPQPDRDHPLDQASEERGTEGLHEVKNRPATVERINIFRSIREDIRAVFERDPAAVSVIGVLLCYPGLHAIWFYRLNHWLWRRKFKLLARLLSQVSRFLTGIEIHPGAQIGRRLFIDHGMGVVIGETSIVGDDVTLYQGVTLGGTGKEKGKRHPTLRDRVFVGNNTNILGNITIGENSRVGAGSVVLRDVPPNSTVVGVPAHIIYREGKRVLITDPHEVQDPLSGVIIALAAEVKRLEARLEGLDGQMQEAARDLDGIRSLAAEDEERESYRTEQLRFSDYVSMGGGI